MNLYSRYKLQLSRHTHPDGSTSSYTTTAGEYNIASAPLYYVRSGYVNIKDGYMSNAGSSGYGWSSRGNGSDRARYLSFDTGTDMAPSGNSFRYNGRSLRCLSTV